MAENPTGPTRHGTYNVVNGAVWCAECGSWISQEVLDDFQHVHFRNAKPSSAQPEKHSLELLNERERTHGIFERAAMFMQDLKTMMRLPLHEKNNFEADQCEALDMIATKLGRICYGDVNCYEHWKDIAGYATLIAERLEKENEKKANFPTKY